jgi:hypothetical protein
MCPYYAGPVYFVVTRFNLQGSETAGNATPPFGDDDDDDDVGGDDDEDGEGGGGEMRWYVGRACRATWY